MADRQFYIDHARHPCGPNFRIYTEPSVSAPDLEIEREEPPSIHSIRLLLYSVQCVVVGKTSKGLCGAHVDGYPIYATKAPGGWLLTGGPHGLLSYGVPNTCAMERFPGVLASIQQHARNINNIGP